jgi:SH3 domain protein
MLAVMVKAETVYVIDELKIGLHEDRSIDSPIIKLVTSGSELSVIERDNELVLVQGSDGIRGWVNNKYIVTEKPGKSYVAELEKNNTALKKQIELLKTTNDTPTDNTEAQKVLEQQLNSERLKAGELQAQLADLRTNIADIDDSGKLLNDIESLKQENQQLLEQLESSGIEVVMDSNSLSQNSFSIGNWKKIGITLLIVFLIGIAGGIFLLDLYNRRRHGGFRV